MGRDKEKMHRGESLESGTHYFIFPDILFFENYQQDFQRCFHFYQRQKDSAYEASLLFGTYMVVPDGISNTVNYSNKDETLAKGT